MYKHNQYLLMLDLKKTLTLQWNSNYHININRKTIYNGRETF